MGSLALGKEGHCRRGQHAQVAHIGALGAEAGQKGLAEPKAALAGIARHHKAGRLAMLVPQHLGGGAAELINEIPGHGEEARGAADSIGTKVLG